MKGIIVKKLKLCFLIDCEVNKILMDNVSCVDIDGDLIFGNVIRYGEGCYFDLLLFLYCVMNFI